MGFSILSGGIAFFFSSALPGAMGRFTVGVGGFRYAARAWGLGIAVVWAYMLRAVGW